MTLTPSLNTKIISWLSHQDSPGEWLWLGGARQHILHLDLLWFTLTRAHVGKWIKPPGRRHTATTAAHSQSENSPCSVSVLATETNKGLFHHKLISACSSSLLRANSAADQTPLVWKYSHRWLRKSYKSVCTYITIMVNSKYLTLGPKPCYTYKLCIIQLHQSLVTSDTGLHKSTGQYWRM